MTIKTNNLPTPKLRAIKLGYGGGYDIEATIGTRTRLVAEGIGGTTPQEAIENARMMSDVARNIRNFSKDSAFAAMREAVR